MNRRTIIRSFRMALLAAVGSASLAACEDSVECTNSQPYVPSQGLESCSNNNITHRPRAVTCDSMVPRDPAAATCDDGNPTRACSVDADCSANGANSFCSGSGFGGCECVSGCVTDADCGTDQICRCGDPVGVCVGTADCKTDADCDGDALCAEYDGECGFVAFACTTSDDECSTTADCTDEGAICTYEGGRRICAQRPCAIGRPFLVGDHQRVAPLTTKADWQVSLENLPALEKFDDEQRQALTAYWSEAGQMEHASVAAFARFTLQLLEVGAPRALLAASQAASLDELRHAQVALTLASHFAGRDISVGPLPTHDAIDATDFADIVRLTIREGCIGETVASLEAAELALRCDDQDLAAVFTMIARDEQSHAELAWRFVAWAYGQAPAVVAAIIDEEIRAHGEHTDAINDHDCAHARLGIATPELRQYLRQLALRDLITPCVNALVGRVGGAVASAATAR